VAFDDCLVDALCARLIRDPAELDVLVMSNLYGDIVADVAAGLAGGIGLVGGVNVGDEVLLFEPAHGTAPRHAGLGRANPTGAILSAALMLRALGELRAADAVEAAVAQVLAEGRTVTYDVVAARGTGVPATTSAMAEAVADAATDALG
jgi:isocitrate dehydrogenase (NAD+)